jgi:hypothetical protein
MPRGDSLFLTSRPLHLTISAILGFAAFTHIYSLMMSSPLDPVTGVIRGFDFLGFYDATKTALHGGILNLEGRFYKPPFVAVLLSPLVFLPFGVAVTFWQLLLVGAVFAVIVALSREHRIPWWGCGALFLAVSLSFPFAFLIDRGNVDAISQACVFFALIAMAQQRVLWSTLLFAVGVHIKTNVLVLAPAVFMLQTVGKTFRSSVIALVCIVLIAMLTPVWSFEWIQVMQTRAGWETLATENGSLARALLGIPYYSVSANLLLGGLYLSLCLGLLRSLKREKQLSMSDRFFLFLPFCQAFPQMSYLYGYVFFPLLSVFYCRVLSCDSISLFSRLLARTGCVGVVLSAFPAYAGQQIFSGAEWPWHIPSLGLLLLLISNAGLVWSYIPKNSEPNSDIVRANHFDSVQLTGIFALILLTFGAALSCLQMYSGNQSGPLWFPRAVNAVGGVTLRGTPFRVRMVHQEYGFLRLNCSVFTCEPLRIAKNEYPVGLGTHSASEIELFLPPESKIFSGTCGIDNENQGRAVGTQCLIFAGETLLFMSHQLDPSNPLSTFTVPVHGARILRLVTKNTGTSNSWNHVDWVELKVEK